MNMTRKELRETKFFLNFIIALAGLLLLFSVFSTLFSSKGVIYYMTDEAGNVVGANYQEELKVYNFVLPIETRETHLNYFSWEMATLYILLFLTFILNFVDLGQKNKIKQYIVSGALIIFSFLLMVIIISYRKEIDLIFEEFLSEYFSSSYINTKNGAVPFLAYSIGIFAGFLSLYKVWILKKLHQLEYENKRYKK